LRNSAEEFREFREFGEFMEFEEFGEFRGSKNAGPQRLQSRVLQRDGTPE